MSEEEKLKVFIKHLEALALEKINNNAKSAMDALKESLHIIEGEMIGY